MKLAIVAPAKSGSTAIYNSCRNALSADERCYAIFEPQAPWPLMKLKNYDFSGTFVTKIMASRMIACGSFFHLDWFDKRILLVRDVKDLMVSELLFRPMVDPLSYEQGTLQEFVRLIQEKERAPQSMSVLGLHEEADKLGISSIDWTIYRDILLHLVNLRSRFSFSVVHYEDYADRDYSGLRQVLGRRVGQTDLSTSWVSHIQRRGQHGEWRTWFTPEDVEFADSFFKEYNKAFQYDVARDYEVNSSSIDPEFGSNYVLKKSAARRRQAEVLSSPDGACLSKDEITLLISRARDGSPLHIRRLAEMYSAGMVPDGLISAEEIVDLEKFGKILA